MRRACLPAEAEAKAKAEAEAKAERVPRVSEFVAKRGVACNNETTSTFSGKGAACSPTATSHRAALIIMKR